jgi:hypothetical protein
VVLHDVAHGADGVVERAAVGDVEVLGHRDLEVVDPLPVPQRLEQRVGEAQHEQVLDGLLAEEVVDPEHPVLGVVLRDAFVQRFRGGQVVPERLLDDQPRARGQARRGDPVGDRAEQRRRHGEVVDGERRGPDGLGEAGEDRRVGVVARHQRRALGHRVQHRRRRRRRTPPARTRRRVSAARRRRGR